MVTTLSGPCLGVQHDHRIEGGEKRRRIDRRPRSAGRSFVRSFVRWLRKKRNRNVVASPWHTVCSPWPRCWSVSRCVGGSRGSRRGLVAKVGKRFIRPRELPNYTRPH